MTKPKSHTITSFYSGYLKFIGESKRLNIPYHKFRLILNHYFKYLRDQILYQSRTVKLPYRMGYVSIIKQKPKRYDGNSLRIDYNATNKYGKVIYHLNEHSNGYKYRFYWSKLQSAVINKSKYQLVATRSNKRELARIIKNKERDYIEI